MAHCRSLPFTVQQTDTPNRQFGPNISSPCARVFPIDISGIKLLSSSQIDEDEKQIRTAGTFTAPQHAQQHNSNTLVSFGTKWFWQINMKIMRDNKRARSTWLNLCQCSRLQLNACMRRLLFDQNQIILPCSTCRQPCNEVIVATTREKKMCRRKVISHQCSVMNTFVKRDREQANIRWDYWWLTTPFNATLALRSNFRSLVDHIDSHISKCDCSFAAGGRGWTILLSFSQRKGRAQRATCEKAKMQKIGNQSDCVVSVRVCERTKKG